MAQSNKPFSYYKKLSTKDKKTYDESDQISFLKIPQVEKFRPYLAYLAQSLDKENKSSIEDASAKVALGLCRIFNVSGVQMKVLSARPNDHTGELHGLYQREIQSKKSTITLWMRTAKRKQVVSFKTYLRTLVHEVLHHLDFTYFNLGESFHTQGFYQRENSLYKQLISITENQKNDN